MSRHISDLQAILMQLAAEHRKLLDQLEAQHAAMKKFDLVAIADWITRSEATRLRINDLESRRRAVMRQITAALKLQQEPRLTRLAELFPPQCRTHESPRGTARPRRENFPAIAGLFPVGVGGAGAFEQRRSPPRRRGRTRGALQPAGNSARRVARRVHGRRRIIRASKCLSTEPSTSAQVH